MTTAPKKLSLRERYGPLVKPPSFAGTVTVQQSVIADLLREAEASEARVKRLAALVLALDAFGYPDMGVFASLAAEDRAYKAEHKARKAVEEAGDLDEFRTPTT